MTQMFIFHRARNQAGPSTTCKKKQDLYPNFRQQIINIISANQSDTIRHLYNEDDPIN